MDTNAEWLEVLLKKYEEQNSVSKVVSTEVKQGTSRGDNYASVINRVTMDIILKSGKKVQKSVIIKELPPSFYTRELFKNMGIFPKEISVYRDILPHIEDIMLEYGDYTGPMWCSMNEYRAYDRIVFHDLKRDGYEMGNRKEGLDLNHSLLVIRSLAKFHATSVILKDRGLIPLEIFGEHMFRRENMKLSFEVLHKQTFQRLTNAMNKWEPEWKPIADRISNEVVPKISSLMEDLVLMDEKKFNVLCHGDCWVNNMLFKYGLDEVTPISMKFLDFQLSFYNSPAFDLKYFLLTSLNLDARKNSVDHLIDTYIEMLNKQLDRYKYKGKRLTLDCLHKELERIELFGLVVTLSVLPMVLLEDAESFPDVEDLCKNAAENVEAEIDFDAFEILPPKFVNIVKDVVKTYVDNHLK